MQWYRQCHAAWHYYAVLWIMLCTCTVQGNRYATMCNPIAYNCSILFLFCKATIVHLKEKIQCLEFDAGQLATSKAREEELLQQLKTTSEDLLEARKSHTPVHNILYCIHIFRLHCIILYIYTLLFEVITFPFAYTGNASFYVASIKDRRFRRKVCDYNYICANLHDSNRSA